ncbi:MAG TPA: alpha/beta hydrolase [Verrucomicrobiae bacterium]|jgi:pimeloyl-ACP methyl ester carboxylesterase|nr:alpha/beta hydrolase [Verrucomicrobiae bacterium]
MASESRWLNFDGLKMHYQTSGSGPAVLLVHGLVGGSYCWRSNLATLSKQHTVFAVDLPGSGMSDAPAGTDCSMKPQVERLSHFIQELRLDDVAVVASSYGGAIALWLAAREHQLRTERIRSLVLVAPANPWSEFGRRRIDFLGTAFGGVVLRMLFPVSWPLHSWGLRRLYGDPSRIARGTKAGYASQIMRPARANNALTMLRSWRADMERVRCLLPQVQVPALVVSGEKDLAVDPRSCAILAQHLPQGEQITLSGLGHLPFEEAPEQFNQMVLEYLHQRKLVHA